jgi:hypothetical protein
MKLFKSTSMVATTLVVGLLFPMQPSWAWGPGGHMIVAYIGYQRLNGNAKTQVDRLIALKIDPVAVTEQSLDFVNASHWPDDLRTPPYKSAFADSFALHFVDYPFSTDHTSLPPNLPGANNIVTALTKYVNILKTSGDDNERAQALRFVIHFVGDIQQPLHCSSLVTHQHANGDEGGNLFLIDLSKDHGGPKNEKLHSYWDGGIGDFPKMGANYAPPPLGEIPPAASRMTARFPDTDPAWKKNDPSAFESWAREGSRLGQEVAYANIKPNQQPTAAYQQAALKTVQQRVVWGGYRLAELLNSIWP